MPICKNINTFPMPGLLLSPRSSRQRFGSNLSPKRRRSIRDRRRFTRSSYRKTGARREKEHGFAVAHAILISIYHMLSRQDLYQDRVIGYLDQQKHKSVTNHLVRRLERLGYQVHLSMEATIPTNPVELDG